MPLSPSSFLSCVCMCVQPPKSRANMEAMATTPSQSSDGLGGTRHQPIAPFPAPDGGHTSGATPADILSPADSVFTHQDSGSSEEGQAHTPSVDPAAAPTAKGGGSEEGSPPNTVAISAFHKSLSDLAHNFSSILISEDEKNVLQSAE